MKKATYIALALIFALSLSGCRNMDADRDDPTVDGTLEDEDRIDSGDVTDNGDGEGLITDHDGSLNLDDEKGSNDFDNGRENSRRNTAPRKIK